MINLTTTILNADEFDRFCEQNPDLQVERTAEGELIIMFPLGGVSGNREADLIGFLWLWNREAKLGKVFSSDTIFRLPNGGDRAPDAAWISNDRWNSLSLEQQEKFPPLCPDFAIELRSRTDSLPSLQNKMREYLNSGLRLGWLIDPQGQKVEIYRRDLDVEVVKLPATLSGENVLPGFVLDLPIF